MDLMYLSQYRVQWGSHMRMEVDLGLCLRQRICQASERLSSSVEELCSMKLLLQDCQSVCQTNYFYIFRCLFLSDTTAPPFCLDENLYRQQLSQDLVVSVYHNGAWGGFHSVSRDCANIVRTQTVDSHLLSVQWYVSCVQESRNIFCNGKVVHIRECF